MIYEIVVGYRNGGSEINACAHLAKLPKELDEGAFAKGVGETGMESQRGVLMGQNSNPPFLIQNKEMRKKENET